MITYRAYAPEFDANSAEVIDANSGDDEPALNESQVTGNYRGTPVSDATTDAVGDEDDPADYELTLKSIAIQKGVNIVGGGDAVPGKVLEYTLDFQISDYFSFKDIKIEDIFSDGQRFDSSFAPTLTISGNDGVVGTTQFENFSGLVNADSSASGNFSAENLTGTLDTGNLLNGDHYHHCCHSNLTRAFARHQDISLDEAEPHIHDVLNVFMCTGFLPSTKQYFMKASPVRPGDYLEFYAEIDYQKSD